MTQTTNASNALPGDELKSSERLQVNLPSASLPVRLVGFVRDSLKLGIAAASINYFAAARHPVDPEKTWNFFTRKQLWPVQAAIDHYPFPAQRRRYIDDVFRQSSAEGVEYHYDVSNDFYELFLDRRFMFYTCADFNSPNDTIEDAQLNKANYILNLLEPKAGEKIVELGCGWGSMLQHVHATTGDKVNLTGITLSKDQVQHIREKFGFNVLLEDFIRHDYGIEAYDKIYSIGGMEHVRPDDVLPLYRRLHAALKPGGRVVEHFFSLNGTDRLPTSMVCAQMFFPGSILSLHEDHRAWAQLAGFRLVHDSSHDYRPTLRAWFDRLVENRDKAHALVGVQTTNKYLAYLAASWTFFERNQGTLHRLVLMKD